MNDLELLKAVMEKQGCHNVGIVGDYVQYDDEGGNWNRDKGIPADLVVSLAEELGKHGWYYSHAWWEDDNTQGDNEWSRQGVIVHDPSFPRATLMAWLRMKGDS